MNIVPGDVDPPLFHTMACRETKAVRSRGRHLTRIISSFQKALLLEHLQRLVLCSLKANYGGRNDQSTVLDTISGLWLIECTRNDKDAVLRYIATCFAFTKQPLSDHMYQKM